MCLDKLEDRGRPIKRGSRGVLRLPIAWLHVAPRSFRRSPRKQFSKEAQLFISGRFQSDQAGAAKVSFRGNLPLRYVLMIDAMRRDLVSR